MKQLWGMKIVARWFYTRGCSGLSAGSGLSWKAGQIPSGLGSKYAFYVWHYSVTIIGESYRS